MPDFPLESTHLPNLSDHCPLLTSIKTEAVLEEKPFDEVHLQNIPRRYIWNEDADKTFRAKIDSPEFNEKVKTLLSSQNNPSLVHDIQELLTSAADLCNIKKSKVKHGPTDPPWFDEDCRNLKDNIRRLGKALRKDPNNPTTRESLYANKSTLRNKIKKNKYLHKKNIVDTMCSNLNRGEKKLYWKMLRKLEKQPDYTSYMHEQQMIDHFKSILNDPSIVAEKGEPETETENSPGILDHPITVDELKAAKRILKAGKSPGMDNILNEMIEPLVEKYPDLVIKLFNDILSNNWICNDWLLSLLTAIHKKGPKEDPDNYRGIALMSCMAKLFLTIINDRLTTYAIDRNILSPAQLGFVTGNRTSDPHIILNNIVQKYCHKKKKKIFGCFIDFSKAFDSVPRDILF